MPELSLRGGMQEQGLAGVEWIEGGSNWREVRLLRVWKYGGGRRRLLKGAVRMRSAQVSMSGSTGYFSYSVKLGTQPQKAYIPRQSGLDPDELWCSSDFHCSCLGPPSEGRQGLLYTRSSS